MSKYSILTDDELKLEFQRNLEDNELIIQEVLNRDLKEKFKPFDPANEKS